MKANMRLVFFGNTGEVLLLRIVFGNIWSFCRQLERGAYEQNNVVKYSAAPHRTAATSTVEYFSFFHMVLTSVSNVEIKGTWRVVTRKTDGIGDNIKMKLGEQAVRVGNGRN
jgi:hypothetical protein